MPEHWNRPAVLKGEGVGVEPYPSVCVTCHSDKFDDWQGSLHARSLSPGLLAQLDPVGDPAFATACYFCHAPASEQSEVTASGGGYVENPSFDPQLQKSGVSCATCHMREGTMYGPLSPSHESGQIPHPTKEEPFFKSAEFCAACHQMDQGYELNGKLLTNTFQEWKESSYGKHNITCQNCHMPGARHLFRGIHDVETVKKGLRFTLKREVNKGTVDAELRIENVEVGHYFPTYVTPLVVVRGFFVDPGGAMIEGTAKEAFIGRKISLDLSEEYFDTRIAPFDRFLFPFVAEVPDGARKFVIEATVYPDEFYNRFFKARLAGDPTNALYKEALKRTEESSFVIYRKAVKVKR